MNAKTLLLSFLLLFFTPVSASDTLSLIPLPAHIVRGNGTFRISKKLRFATDAYKGDSIALVLAGFSKDLATTYGITFTKTKPSKAALHLSLNNSLKEEAYKLNITTERITIEASRPIGFFYALQTLRQLMPLRAVAAGCIEKRGEVLTLPIISISDEPRFGWRGFMLDEGRHFFGKETVKKILDVMAMYKMNRFHWHLTDDQGWRIEIKKYPRLTSVGAWRESEVLGWGDVKPDGKRYGGFYTQEDIREIVEYARSRFIEIVPEVDIPGHSQAAIAAYPELLACDPDKRHDVWLCQGISDDVINVSNPAAVQFAKDIVDELTDIFPFGFLHLGGDECPTDKWRGNIGCQELLKSIGSENYRDLQIYFYNQIKRHIAQKPLSEHRRLIFWNEILHGDTAPLGNDITVMAWVGANAAAKETTARGMTTILSPQIPYYINRRQSPLPSEPRSQGTGTETLEAVYEYAPAKDITATTMPQYLGVQANFWSEWVCDASTLQYLMLPRLAAVAEAAWTPQALRSYADFLVRLQAEAEYYRMKGLNYAKHAFRQDDNSQNH